ncbi:VOC family protein [Halocatena halophila]|uniref:VOC family protein n=1 Tax=Halocatena halophila TaxID=2814576 RepID=UPI002ED551CB
MAFTLQWLALEVKYLDRSRSFYERVLDCSLTERNPDELCLSAGETDLILRRPNGVPRGGVHTHFAFSTPADAYEEWYDRLESHVSLTEATFGSARSLYFDDPDDHCVEIGQQDVAETESLLCGIFEVVLEVTDLERALGFYTDLGFTVVDRGTDRRRCRLSGGTFDLELWEPHLGIADARGGCHVDLGIELSDGDRKATIESVEDQATVGHTNDNFRLIDPDGHRLTLI